MTTVPFDQINSDDDKAVTALLRGKGERHSAQLLAVGLLEAFSWDMTPEGWEYWRSVYEKLSNLSMK